MKKKITYKYNICKKEMTPVYDIKLEGFLIGGWRCECGQIHSNPEDADKIVRYLRTLSTSNTEEFFDIIIPEGDSSDERILRRTKEAEKAYRDGDVKIGSFEDFWKDMND